MCCQENIYYKKKMCSNYPNLLLHSISNEDIEYGNILIFSLLHKKEVPMSMYMNIFRTYVRHDRQANSKCGEEGNISNTQFDTTKTLRRSKVIGHEEHKNRDQTALGNVVQDISSKVDMHVIY